MMIKFPAVGHSRFDSITSLVRSKTSFENIKRLLQTKDMPYTIEEGNDIKVNIKKGQVDIGL
ncbi:MAG TPA: hypothetical protein PLR60_14455 [Syntrophorhabdaceae bacterium]|nr:hypothetical protein [Syntrophorhabdaceae bacterium]HRZ22144.1 hypothetical protein [Bacteroidales bacterium]